MRQTTDGSITVLQGRCVGGSTVHNLCYAFRTPPPILQLWREGHGLPSLTDASLDFERVTCHVVATGLFAAVQAEIFFAVDESVGYELSGSWSVVGPSGLGGTTRSARDRV